MGGRAILPPAFQVRYSCVWLLFLFYTTLMFERLKVHPLDDGKL